MSGMLCQSLLKNKLPAGLKQASCEKYDPNKWGVPLAIRFVPAKPSEEDEGEEKQMPTTITLSEGVTKTFWEFDSGEPKDFIGLVNRHIDLLKDLKLKEKFKAMKKVKSD